jgi:hypothetical protein
LSVYNEEHQAMFIATTSFEHDQLGSFSAGDELVFSFTFDNLLAPGRYGPVIQLAHRGAGVDVIDKFTASFSFVVTGSQPLGGLFDVPVVSRVDRNGAEMERTGV